MIKLLITLLREKYGVLRVNFELEIKILMLFNNDCSIKVFKLVQFRLMALKIYIKIIDTDDLRPGKLKNSSGP